jgi:hypothetical protein
VRDRNEDHFLIARLSKAMQICSTSLPGDGQAPFSEEEEVTVGEFPQAADQAESGQDGFPR